MRGALVGSGVWMLALFGSIGVSLAQTPGQTGAREPSRQTERSSGQTSGRVGGKVMDPQGAVIVGATVALVSGDGALSLKTVTDEAGLYRFVNVAGEHLMLEVAAPGFRPFARPLRATSREDEDITLELAGQSESLVVTIGTRGPMQIDKSPVSTSLITRADIENRNIHHVDQALTLTEGVNGSRARGPGDNDFGVGLRGFSGMGGAYRTLILLDGQPLNNSFIGSVNWATLAPSEVERVEVARGPFSSLYGGNAMGGVINLVTRSVSRRELEGFGQYGNRDTTNYSVRAADRFFGKLGLAFGYSRFRTDGYESQEVLRTPATTTGGTAVTGITRWATPTGGVTYQVGWQGRNWFEQQAYRVRGEYTFSPKVFMSAQYMRQSRSAGYGPYSSSLRDASGNVVDNGTVSFVDGGVVRHVTVTPANFIGIPTGQRSSIYQTQALAMLTPKWNLRAAGGFSHSPTEWFVSPGANATLSSGSGNYTNTTNRAVYANLQATRAAAEQTLIAGVETRADSARTGSQPIPNYLVRDDGGPFETQAFGKTLNHAAYVQYQRDVLARLNVVAGARVDSWRTYDGGSQAGSGLPVTHSADRSTQALTGKVAAVYALPGNWQVRGSVGNAFRNPTIFEMYRDFVFFGSFLLGNPDAKSERLTAYEGGIGHTGRVHSFTASVYENRIADLIFRTVDPSDPTGRTRRLTNAARARGRGLELSARQNLTAWLQLREFYTYTNTIITRNPGLPETVGKRSPFLPDHTVGCSAIVTLPRVTVSWDGRYVGSMYSSGTNTDTTNGVPGAYDPFFEMGISGTFKATRHFSVVASADNLLDRRYHLFYLAQGRSVFAGLRFRR